MPVTERSEELDKVLETFTTRFDEDEWAKRLHEAIEYRREVFRTNPRKVQHACPSLLEAKLLRVALLPPVITVIGKEFFDIAHSLKPKGQRSG